VNISVSEEHAASIFRVEMCRLTGPVIEVTRKVGAETQRYIN
jgi:hypothetical protein